MIKHKLNTLFWALFICLICFSCSDDDPVVIEEDNPYREFMTMFRYERNGISSDDPYVSKVTSDVPNDIQLYWYGVNGAAGYHVKAVIQGRNFDSPYDLVVNEIVGPEVLNMKVEDLQYSTGYRFAIKVLSSRGAEYDSKWFGVGDGAHPDDYMNLTTRERYAVPDVLRVEDIDKTSFRVSFDLTSNGQFSENFQEKNGKYLMDQIKIEPSSDNPALPTMVFDLTDADKQRGYIDVDGLTQNCVYIVNGLNNAVVRYWDRLYNTNMVRMKGNVGEPITIKHIFDPNDTIPGAIPLQACRIDTVLRNYMRDSELAEGTTFILESGKNYYFVNTISMSKGFTLKSNATRPEDRPTVYFGVGTDASGNAVNCNLSFGRNASNGEMGGINVQSIYLENINFDCDKAKNYMDNLVEKAAITQNYFINQSSQAMPFALESFEIRNCNFRGFIRGWIRFQGPNRKIVDKFVIDNCLFYENGVYDNNGRGYSWIDGGGGTPNNNIFRDFQMTNCTFVDSPRHALLGENNNLAWTSPWHIRIENNTFINFSTRSNDRVLFEMRYIPNNSTIICKKNLFVMTRKGSDDNRTLQQGGMDVRNFNGLTFDFDDNYSTIHPTRPAANAFMSSYLFSATNYGAGWGNGSLNVGGIEATRIKLGTGNVGLEPTDLFIDPNPLGKNGDINMHKHNLNGLYFKNTNQVRNHEIYTKGIGDPRWRVNVTP